MTETACNCSTIAPNKLATPLFTVQSGPESIHHVAGLLVTAEWQRILAQAVQTPRATVCSPFQKKLGGGGIPQSRFEPVISQTLKCYLHSTATCSMIWGMQTGWITGLTKRTPTQKLYVYYARAQTNKQTNKQTHTHTHSYICTNQDTIKNSTKSLRSVERIVNLVNNIFLYPNTIASASINRR